MSSLFVFASFSMCVALAFCVFDALKKRSILDRRVAMLDFFALLEIFFCTLSVFSRIFWFSFALCIATLAIFDFFTISLLLFSSSFTEFSPSKRLKKYARAIILIFCLSDFVLLLISPFSHTLRTFYLSPIFLNDSPDAIFSYELRFNPTIFVHFSFFYAVLILTFLRFLHCSIFRAGIFRWKYISMLCCFFALLISSVAFLIFGEQYLFPILCGVVSIIASIISLHVVPAELNARMKILVTEDISNAVVCFDKDGKIVFKNSKAREILSDDALCAQKLADFNETNRASLTRPEGIVVFGEGRIFNAVYRRLFDKRFRLIGTFLALTDITSESEELVSERFRSETDPLTGLFNRAHFFREAQRELRNEPNEPRYFVCTNIRNFKLVNALFGSEFGDLILMTQARMLKKANYPGTIRGRISGDRFAMLIKKKDFNPELAIKNTERIQDFMGDIRYKLHISLAVYEITDTTENVHAMYDKTSLALRDIKDDYSQTLVFYDSAFMEKLVHEKWIVSSFEAALSSSQFEMYLQPQVGSKLGKVVGAEALVRWNHQERGKIPPSEFVPILEKSGHIYKLDSFIWEEAAKKLSDWKKRGIDLYIAVNISAKDFYYLDLYSVFTNLVEKYEISPSKFKLEITETVIMNNVSSHAAVLSRLQNAGFQIEMDDFGSGYSSLNLLCNLHTNVLKIDMAFLSQTENTIRAKKIILSIIKLAKVLKMTVVIEGVETEEQVLYLSEMGADIFQGYFFSRPLSALEFEERYSLGGEK